MDVEKVIRNMAPICFILGVFLLMLFVFYGSYPVSQQNYSVFEITGTVSQINSFDSGAFITVNHECSDTVIVDESQVFRINDTVSFVGTAFEEKMVALRATVE